MSLAHGRWTDDTRESADSQCGRHSAQRSEPLAAGIAFALLLALIPGGNLLWIALFALTLLLKINLAAELLFLALFKLAAPLADGLLHRLGYWVLTRPLLQDPFTAAYNLPLLPLSRFNNTIQMGGLLAGLLLWVPVFLHFRFLVPVYRRRWRERIAGSRVGGAQRAGAGESGKPPAVPGAWIFPSR